MSRCLPFSPDAFSNRRSSHEALIKKEKEERKMLVRRDEELKKKLRKEHIDKAEKKHKYVSNDIVTKPCHKKYYPQTGIKADKYSSDESENSEKSDITEEHEPPTYSGSVYNMLDSSESTNKRKRIEDGSVNNVESPKIMFRIRLSAKKSKTSDSSSVELGKNFVQKESEFCPREKPKWEVEKPSTKPCQDMPLSAPERRETGDTKKAKSHVKHLRRSTKSMYKMLIEDWVPPSFQEWEEQIGAEDWLFESRNPQCRTESESHEASNDEASCSRSSPTWSRANYLSHIGVYALPFTVPF